MLELKFVIYYRAGKSPLTGFLWSIGWRIIDQTRLSSNTHRTPTVFLLQ